MVFHNKTDHFRHLLSVSVFTQLLHLYFRSVKKLSLWLSWYPYDGLHLLIIWVQTAFGACDVTSWYNVDKQVLAHPCRGSSSTHRSGSGGVLFLCRTLSCDLQTNIQEEGWASG